MMTITPCLWFDNNLEEAAQFYTSVFPNSSVEGFTRYTDAGPGKPGDIAYGTFVLDGHRYLSRQSVETMTRVFTPDVKPSGWLGGTGYGLTFEIVNQPEGTLLLHSPGTFGHGGAFGTEGWIDPKNDLIRIMLVQSSDSSGSAPRSVVMQMGEAAVLDGK